MPSSSDPSKRPATPGLTPVETLAETVISDPCLAPSAPPLPNEPKSVPVHGGTAIFKPSKDEASESSEASGSATPIRVNKAFDPETRELLLARLVVEKGLATAEEVERCKGKKASPGFLGRRRSMAQLLVEQQAITPNQLARLEVLIDQQRTSRSIPGFKMLGKLGKGTSATVYRARQLNLDRLVAIKVLPPTALHSGKAVQQFYFEGRAAAQLNHRNIVQAFDVGQHSDFHYFVMEYVEGRTVHEILAERVTMDAEEALDVVIAVAEALRHAHEKGFVHRDVKPKNIIIDPKGTPKLADLGLARAMADLEAALAEKGHALGTPYYISPEQVRGDMEIGPPADIYGLGATFYHMLTGVPPFTGTDAKEVMTKHLNEPVRPPAELVKTIPPGLSEVVEKMLNKDPATRYTDCEMLLLDLNAWKAVFTLQRGEAETGRNFQTDEGGGE